MRRHGAGDEIGLKRLAQGLLAFVERHLLGAPEEVGAIVATLASGRLPYTTGQAISADAGMLVPRY